MRIFALIFVTCMFAGTFAAAEETTPPPCDPVVRFFGETVCRSALHEETPEYLDAMNVPQEQRPLLLEQMKERNRKQMLDLLWQKALIQKFGADAITPAEPEVEKFRTGFKAVMKTSYEADKQTVAYLKDVLEKDKFAADAESQLRDIVAAAETGIKFYEEREKQLAGLPEDYAFVTETAEKEIARNLLKRWKSDNILFDIHRGRLLLGQNGPEPVDGYEKFLTYIDEKGGFEAVDLSYADIFAEVRNRGKTGGEIVPEDSNIYKNYFTDPTWQFNLSNSGNRLGDLKKWVDGLPRQ